MVYTLDSFISKTQENFDINRISIDDAIKMLQTGTFDKYFDRHKILSYLKDLTKRFESEFLSREFCKHCGSFNVKEIPSGYWKKRFLCLDCGKTFMQFGVIRTHFDDWVVGEVAEKLSQGDTIREIYKSLVNKASAEDLKRGNNNKIPDEKSIYDITERLGEALSKYTEFNVLLTGGISCKRLLIDDFYSKRTKNRKLKQTTLGGGVLKKPNVSKRKKKKQDTGPFFYPIACFDPDRLFLVNLHPAFKRNFASFNLAIGRTVTLLNGLPEVVMGDKLGFMIKAAERHLPRSLVKHIFIKRKPWRKGELKLIERKIKDIRRTLHKQRKFGTFRLIKSMVIIAQVNENYLEPRKSLGGKSAAINVGIPYPFKPYCWNTFLKWVRFVIYRLPSILKVGLKQIPGTPLRPSTTAN